MLTFELFRLSRSKSKYGLDQERAEGFFWGGGRETYLGLVEIELEPNITTKLEPNITTKLI